MQSHQWWMSETFSKKITLNYCTNFCLCAHGCITPTSSWQAVTVGVVGGKEEWTVIYYLGSWYSGSASSRGEATVCVTCDARKRGVSAQFDEPSEPERRQPLRKPNWLPWGWRDRERERRRRGKEGKESRKSDIKTSLSRWKIQSWNQDKKKWTFSRCPALCFPGSEGW